jgi:hypothetical protein
LFLVSNTTYLILTLRSNSVRSVLHIVPKLAFPFNFRYPFTLYLLCLNYKSNQHVAVLVEPCPSKSRDDGSNLVPASLLFWLISLTFQSHVITIIPLYSNTNQPLAWVVSDSWLVTRTTRVRTSLVLFLILIYFPNTPSTLNSLFPGWLTKPQAVRTVKARDTWTRGHGFEPSDLPFSKIFWFQLSANDRSVPGLSLMTFSWKSYPLDFQKWHFNPWNL